MGRADSLEKTLRLVKIEGRKRREWQDEIVGWHEQTAGDSEGQGNLACYSPEGHKQLNILCKDGHNKGQKWCRAKEAEHTQNRWQEYTEELSKNYIHDLDNNDGVITHLEPDIL